jgi:peptidylprolyl isomerase
MATDKRDRQKAARRARLEAEAARERKRRSVRRVATTVVLFVVGAALLFTLTGGDGGDDESLVETDDTTTTTSVPEYDPVAAHLDPETGEFAFGEGECAPEDGAEEQSQEFDDSPALCITPDEADYRATIETSTGTFVADLYDDRAPGTVNSFVNLARWKYFDGIIFHRVIPNFVLQGGDPTGTGLTGPGYELADELPETVDAYVPGSLAMANAGPNTGGSQFFVYLGPNPLPGPLYSLFGQVTEATLDVPLEIATVATGEGDKPVEDIVILSVTIETLSDGEIDDDAAFPTAEADADESPEE